MSLSETRTFLEDLLGRYDPDLDISLGSKAQVSLIEPILQRIGIDPFDEEIENFIRTRVRQSFPTLAITEADDLTDTLIDPMKVLFEPLVREVKLVKLRASLRNVESLSDDEVDALMGNFFEGRRSGGYAIGPVRAFFSTPQTVSLTLTSPGTTRDGRRFFPTRPQAITADQMQLNVDGSEYYFDINFTAENRGDEYNVDPGEIVSIANLPTATRVKNLRRFRGGAARENSTAFTGRVQGNISDKTLTVEPGISSTLFENFPALRTLFTIGFKDPEMLRDVVTGGGLGPVPPDDLDGHFYGAFTLVDDLNGNATTQIISTTPGGFFVSRLGAVGSMPLGWFITITYLDTLLVLHVVDVPVLEVLSQTLLRVSAEIPLIGTSNRVWMLRQQKIEISGIPGGISLPDTPEGFLEIRPDQVHIGGKSDVYVAGPTDDATANIDVLTDENPVTRGFQANTFATDIVVINDAATVTRPIAVGMSLVLEEGSDAGSYSIIAVAGTGPGYTLTLDTAMTGTQTNLSFRVVDDIDVTLTDPQALKIDGSDMITAAGSPFIFAASGTNWQDVNVVVGDIVQIIDELGGGEFSVVEVGAITLKVSPVLPRTLVAVAYRIFHRSQATLTPVVRVKSLELLDSAGAPTGTKIPYRDPVLVVSRGFQNEGAGDAFDGLVFAGLVSRTSVTVLPDVSVPTIPGLGGSTLIVNVYDARDAWLPVLAIIPHVFGAGTNTPALAAAEINADFAFATSGIAATTVIYAGREYLGLVSNRLLVTAVSSALGPLGLDVLGGDTNAQVQSYDPLPSLQGAGIRRTDLISFITGNNAGRTGRVLTDARLPRLTVDIGSGPLGPEGIIPFYDNAPLLPDVGSRAILGRPSIGTARAYFLDPTSASFDYRQTNFRATVNGATHDFQPDPENQRVLLPAYPRTDLPDAGVTTPGILTDISVNFLILQIRPGDLIDILYRPIVGTSALPPGTIAIGSRILILRLDHDPFITIQFPTNMNRDQIVDYINSRVGSDIASLDGTNTLVLKGSRRIEIDSSSDVLLPLPLPPDPLFLFGAPRDTDHPQRGERIITSVTPTTVSVLGAPLIGSVPDTHYQIKRYLQRFSSTEMNLNVDPSGLYFTDVQLVSRTPGDTNNIETDVPMEPTGVVGDGYRLSSDSDVLSYSRAEVLRMHVTPTILLVGSSDSPEEYVHLAPQSVQVAYDRSQLADDIQSFCDSDFHRVVVEEILVKHLLPHYVLLNWSYIGGSSEADMSRAVTDALDAIEAGDPLEVGDLVNVLRRKGATSVFTPSTSDATGRIAPLFLVVYHDADRVVRGLIVKDLVDSVRMQRYIPDVLTLKRTSTGGIR